MMRSDSRSLVMRTFAVMLALLTTACASPPESQMSTDTPRSPSSSHPESYTSAVTFGNSDVQLCFNAAEFQSLALGSVDHCNSALESRGLSRKERVATLVNRGIVFNHQQNYAAAFADFETALALDSEVSAAYVNRGNSYSLTQQFDLAIEDYTTALQMNPTNPYIAHFNRGLAYEAKQQADLAFEDFVRVTELRPGWAPAVDRVELYRKQGFKSGD